MQKPTTTKQQFIRHTPKYTQKILINSLEQVK